MKMKNASILVGAAVVIGSRSLVALAIVVIDGKALVRVNVKIHFTIIFGRLLAALHAIISVSFHGGHCEATVRGLEHPDRATTRHQEQQSTGELKGEPLRRTAAIRGHRPGFGTEGNRRGFLIRNSIRDSLVSAGLLLWLEKSHGCS